MDQAGACPPDRAAEDMSGRVKDEFMSRMSHELRTPISAILGLTHMASNTPDPEKTAYYLTQIDKSARHLLEIVNDVLDMSRINLGELELSHDRFDIEQVVTGAIDTVRAQSAEKKQRLYVQLDPALPRFYVGDAARIKQVMTILLSNAVKFTPEKGSVTLGLEHLSRDGSRSCLRISVRDDGIGIAPEKQADIFRPFEQVDGSISRGYEGTGLGLPICRSIVQAMDGEIGVESSPGEGSLFYCTIFVVSEQELLMKQDAGLDGLRVLIADPDPAAGGLLKSIAAACRIDCQTAETAEACAVAFARAEEADAPFDVVLLDKSLLENGFEETGRVLSHAVIMSAENAVPSDEDESRDFDRVLTKPILPGALIACLKKAAGARIQAHNILFANGLNLTGSRAAADETLSAPERQPDLQVPPEETHLYVNVEAALENMRGNRTVYKTLLAGFKRNTYCDQLRGELERDDKDSALRTLSALRGLTGKLSLPAIEDCLTVVETHIRRGFDTDEALEYLGTACGRTLGCIDRVLDSL